jgi:hypothetical protein
VFTPILPALAGGRVWDTSQLHTAGVISVGGTSTVIGDHNGDGDVNAADYVTLRVGGADSNQFNLWQTNFGSTGAGSGTGSSDHTRVPEPACISLHLVIAFALAPWRRLRVVRRRNDVLSQSRRF